MIKINETYYELELTDILNELKKQLSSKGIYLFNQIKELPDDLMVSCPFHKNGQEKRPSCGIRKEDGWCHCFTCGESMSLLQMISRCWDRDDLGQYGLRWLKDNFIGDINNKRNINLDLTRNGTWTTGEIRCISEKELDKYRYWHPYMQQRKLTDEVIDLFDIGYDERADCITFPIKDKDGNCLFIARRSVKTKFFNYPSNVEKPIYGVYELYRQKEFPKEVYICESMIDALTLWGIGKYAVAMNGLGTEKQFEELRRLPCKKYILATDNDKAGLSARKKLRQQIKNKLITEVILPNNRKDINECTKEELESLQEIM